MDLKGKKVLITGADGFIGSHLVELLLAEGCQVRAFVFYNSFNSWGWLDTFSKDVLKKIEVIAGDIRDPHGVRSVMKDIEVVFHLASLIAIPFSYHSPDAYVDTNVKGALNILQASRELETSRIVMVSTSEVYGTARYVPIDERHPFQTQSPYAAAKLGADRLAESFYCSFGTPIVIARPFNTYGPRQSARAVIPTIITQVLAGAPEIKLGSLTPTRDLNYVEDTCRGLVALAKCEGAIGKEVNIGSGTEVSIGELATQILKYMGSSATISHDKVRTRPERSEVERLVCDSRLIKTLTGWKSSVSLQEGLRRTIEWFRNPDHLKRYKNEIYNL